MYELVTKMPFTRTMNMVVIVFGCLVAPYWYLTNVFPEILANKDIFQIILICTSISLPPYFLHFIIGLMTDNRFKSKSNRGMEFKFRMMAFLSLVVGGGFYLLVIIFYDESFRKTEKINFSVWLQAGLILVMYLVTIVSDLQRRWRFATIIVKRLGLKQTKAMHLLLMANKIRTDFLKQWKGT